MSDKKIISLNDDEAKKVIEKFKTQILPNPKIKAIFKRLKDK